MSTAISIPAIANLTHEQADEIQKLMMEVRGEFKKCREHEKKSKDHAKNAGRALLQLKDMMPHGAFRICLHTIGIKKSTASNHMRIARANVQLLDNCTGVRDALKAIKADSKKDNLVIDAEIVDDAPTPAPAPAHAPAPAPEADDDDDDAAPLLVDGTKPISDDDDDHEDTAKHLPEYVHDDAMRHWSIARTTLGKILHQDASRVKALTECIQYCQYRLDKKTDALAAIVATLPRLTEEERKTLTQTLNSKNQ